MARLDSTFNAVFAWLQCLADCIQQRVKQRRAKRRRWYASDADMTHRRIVQSILLLPLAPTKQVDAHVLTENEFGSEQQSLYGGRLLDEKQWRPIVPHIG